MSAAGICHVKTREEGRRKNRLRPAVKIRISNLGPTRSEPEKEVVDLEKGW